MPDSGRMNCPGVHHVGLQDIWGLAREGSTPMCHEAGSKMNEDAVGQVPGAGACLLFQWLFFAHRGLTQRGGVQDPRFSFLS